MPFMTLDREKCKRDGICIEECPLGYLEYLPHLLAPIRWI